MAQAKKVSDIPGRQEIVQGKKDAASRMAARAADLAGNTFEELTPPQRDKLLKQLAVAAGLIEDSED